MPNAMVYDMRPPGEDSYTVARDHQQIHPALTREMFFEREPGIDHRLNRAEFEAAISDLEDRISGKNKVVFNMKTYFLSLVEHDFDDYLNDFQNFDPAASCSTAACLAGDACIRKFGLRQFTAMRVPTKDHRGQMCPQFNDAQVHEMARIRFGMTHHQAQALFLPENWTKVNADAYLHFCASDDEKIDAAIAELNVWLAKCPPAPEMVARETIESGELVTA